MTSEQMEIWHNPRCSKSRAAKQALDDAGVSYTERRYLEQPPTAQELRDILDRLDGSLELAEPFARIRGAIQEARKMGVTGRVGG